MARIKIICGLGNPGPRYCHTRHNVGFDVVDRLVLRLNLPAAARTEGFEFRLAAQAAGDVYLIKPTMYVNRSGEAVREALVRFSALPGEVFVISDDFYLPLGALRMRKSGSSGGHNGLQSIIDEIGTTAFPRLRAGIGPLAQEMIGRPEAAVDFVLSRFRADEEDIVTAMISRAVEAVELVLSDRLDLAIRTYNNTNPTPES